MNERTRTTPVDESLPGLRETLQRAATRDFDVAAVQLRVTSTAARRRRQRDLGAGLGALLTVAVVAGTMWAVQPGGMPDGSGIAPAGTTVVSTGPSPTQAPVPSPSQISSPTPSQTASPDEASSTGPADAGQDYTVVAYDIPDSVQLSDAELGGGRTVTADHGQYANPVAVSGQYCQDPTSTGPDAVAGRMWSYGHGGGDFDGVVDVNVSGWAPGTGPDRLADVIQDDGRCRWLDPVTQVPASGWVGEEGLLLQAPAIWGSSTAMVVQRAGDVLVGVTARSEGGQDAAAAEARRVGDLVTQKLLDTGLEAVR